MPERLLLDTDVLVDYLRDHPAAVDYLDGVTDAMFISTVTIAELYAGVRDGSERARLDALATDFDIAHVDHAIAVRGGLYRRDFGKSHNVGLADALIAATAELGHAALVTLNRKHFPMLSDVRQPYRKS